MITQQPPTFLPDPVIDVYKKAVDRVLLRKRLKLTPTERFKTHATPLNDLFKQLGEAGVNYILAGGVAAIAHGAARATDDVDIVYDRLARNLQRIVTALQDANPYPRGAASGLPYQWGEATVRNGLNFSLATSLGNIDLLGELTGIGDYRDILPFTKDIEIFGVQCRCLDLQRLIVVKRAVGRPADYEALAELEALYEEQNASKESKP